MQRSLLEERTRASGAILGESSGWQIPLHYGDSAAEVKATRECAGMRDSSHWGRVLISGADHLDFLHRMTTNHFQELADRAGLEAAFTENRARILDLGTFYRRNEQTLAVLSPGAIDEILSWLDRYIFAEEISFEEITGQTAMVELFGPRAGEMVQEVFATDISVIQPHHLLETPSSGVLWTARLDRLGHPGLRATGDSPKIAVLWEKLLKMGAQPVGEEAWDILRIEAGIPARGRELTDEHNPWEAGLAHAIHMNKGCYIGQEVIARLEAYDKIKQHLVGLRWDEGSLPPSGTELRAERKTVGQITSAVYSPLLKRNIALGYVRRAHCALGTILEFISATGPQAVEVVGLPFAAGA